MDGAPAVIGPTLLETLVWALSCLVLSAHLAAAWLHHGLALVALATQRPRPGSALLACAVEEQGQLLRRAGGVLFITGVLTWSSGLGAGGQGAARSAFLWRFLGLGFGLVGMGCQHSAHGTSDAPPGTEPPPAGSRERLIRWAVGTQTLAIVMFAMAGLGDPQLLGPDPVPALSFVGALLARWLITAAMSATTAGAVLVWTAHSVAEGTPAWRSRRAAGGRLIWWGALVAAGAGACAMISGPMAAAPHMLESPESLAAAAIAAVGLTGLASMAHPWTSEAPAAPGPLVQPAARPGQVLGLLALIIMSLAVARAGWIPR